GVGRDFTNTAELYGLDDRWGQTVNDPGPYTISTPPRSTLPVIDVISGDIATALAQAGTQHVIVHVPFGQYVPSSSLNVGPNVVLVGDGSSTGGSDITAGTGVDPVLHLPGPSHAVVAELGVNSTHGGSKQGTDVLIDHADQPSGLVHIEMPSGSDNHRGLDAENLSSTIVQLQDGGISGGNQAMNDPGPNVDYYVANATVRQFMGASTASDALYEMHGGTLVVQQRFYQGADNGQVTPPDSMVIPGSSGILVLDEGNFASGQGNINLTSFSGPVTAIGIGETTNCNTGKSAAFGADTLLLGYLFGWSDTGAPPSCTTPPSALAPSLLWQLRHSNGGGTDLTNSADQNLGVSDTARFVRDHLMPLRAARPLSPGGRAAGTTDVQLIRLGISGSLAGVKVVGNANPAPTARHPARI
ncbi:MAG: hypothetical protein JOZ81_33460, partial [Chloroflexi bacterium]|nr:hypothetical protein [Chloroflexota bacterium]